MGSGKDREIPEGFTQEEWEELERKWTEGVPFHDLGIESIRALLVGLARECPFGGNPEDCCMNRIRQMPFRDRVNWVFNLSDDEIEIIYGRHLECSQCKANKLRTFKKR